VFCQPLHFNTLVPVATNDGLQSVPIAFIEGYEGEKLKRAALVKKSKQD